MSGSFLFVYNRNMIKVKSPLYYNGNKYSLLDDISPHIPKNPNGIFYDVFGGSGTMSLNFAKKFKKAIYNEMDTKVYGMFNWALNIADTANLRQRMLTLDKTYGFMLNLAPEENQKDVVASGRSNERPEYQGWLKFIQDEKITTDQEPELLYIASCFSFSHTLKFKNDGYLQASWGVREFKPSLTEKFGNMKSYRDRIECVNRPFQEFPIDDLKPDDFVYLDPPYFGTQGNYNKFWTMTQELELFAFCEELTKRGIKWAMSNVFTNKGHTNGHLKAWTINNKYKVWHFQHNYAVNGASGEADEVLICNYDYDESPQPIAFDFGNIF